MQTCAPDAVTVQTVQFVVRQSGPLEMDLYLPAAAADHPRPGVLCVHGGGWTGGKRPQFAWHARQLAARGYVAASTSYRLAGQAVYPAALDDVQAAMRYLRSRALELGLDGSRLGAMGSSAGGHLVACLGCRETRDAGGFLPEHSSRANCVVDVHGVHDLPWVAARRMLKESILQFLGGTVEEKPALAEDASPLRFVDSHSAPTLILHDPADPSVPYEDSVRFADALVRAHRPVRFVPTPGSGHGYVYHGEGAWTQRVWPDVLHWLDRHLVG